MVPLHTVSLKFFSYFVVQPNLVKRRHTLAQGEVASQVESDARSMLIFVLALFLFSS